MAVSPSLRRRAGGALAVAALTAGTLAAAGTAAADTAILYDTRGDMAGHGADIHKVRVDNDKQIRIRIKHANLVRSFKSGSGGAVYFDTDRSRKGPEFVFIGGLFQGTDYALLKAKGWKSTGRRVLPPGCSYDMKLDYAKDVTRISVGRACLSEPGRVRVAVRTTGDKDGDTVRDWLDGRRQFTPWVARR